MKSRAERYETAFLILSGVMLVVFLGALFYAAWGMGVNVPGRVSEIDPTQVRSTEPFDEPGIQQTGPESYEVVMIGQAWAFQPREVRIPAGSEVTFVATSVDVIHGFHLEGTRVNVMLIPGQVSRVTHTFDEPGEHLFICHEYCGAGHHNMYGRLIVQ